MGQHDEFLEDFLEECDENLDCLVQLLVVLEEDPTAKDQLPTAVRAMHTIKGSSGFFGFINTHVLARAGEAVLARIRDGELEYQPRVAETLMATVDAIREILERVQQSGAEGNGDYSAVRDDLEEMGSSAQSGDTDPPQ